MKAGIIIALLGLVGVSQAINCYTCSSTGSDCADPFAAAVDKEQDCTAFGYIDDGGCSKLKSYAKVLGIDIYTVVRTCGKSYDNTQCAQADRLKISILGVKSETWSCACDGALCNGGTAPAMSFALLTACVAKFFF